MTFWISGFFFPQGFLTSVLQSYSRGNQVPVDVLGFDFGMIEYESPADFEEAQKENEDP